MRNNGKSDHGINVWPKSRGNDQNVGAAGMRPGQNGRAPQPNAVQSAVFGAVLGVGAVGHCLALAALFFTGALLARLGLATGIFLMSSLCATLALYGFSQFRPPWGLRKIPAWRFPPPP